MLEGDFGPAAAILVQIFEFFVGEILDRSKFVFGALHGQHQFGQLELDRQCVAVLRILNQKHHQECDNGGAGIDDELPRVGVMKGRTRGGPDDNDEKPKPNEKPDQKDDKKQPPAAKPPVKKP